MLQDAPAMADDAAPMPPRSTTAPIPRGRGQVPGRKFHRLRNVSLDGITDAQAKAYLAQYGRLIRSIVVENRYRLPSRSLLDREDMVAIANGIMLQAIVTYDPNKGMKMSSWICLLVRQHLRTLVREAFGTTAGEEASYVRGEPVETPLWRRPPVSLDEPMLGRDDWDKDFTRLSTIACDRRRADEELEEEQERAWLAKAVAKLSDRERLCVLEVSRGTTYEVIGDVLGITRQRVEQIYHASLEKLRRSRRQDDAIRQRRRLMNASS